MKTAARRDARHRRIEGVVTALQRIIQSVHTYSKHSLRAFGVTGPQIWALREIAAHPGVVMGDLAEVMYLHVSTVSGLIDRLEERGFVRRERDDQDQRVVHLQITARGRAVVRTTPEPPRSRLPRGLEALSTADLTRMARSLWQLGRIMEVEGTPARFEDWT